MERKDKDVLDQNINQKRIKATNFLNSRIKKYRKRGWTKKILSHIRWLLSLHNQQNLFLAAAVENTSRDTGELQDLKTCRN